MTAELGPTLLEMLRQTVPKLTHVAIFVNPSNANIIGVLKTEASAQKRPCPWHSY
jgi:hypothetical protein